MDTVKAHAKIKEMISDDVVYLIKETERLLNCGGIDADSYDDNYVLPKIVLYAALKNLAYQRRPHLDSYRKDAENLTHF